jgi:hypothetical protein
MINTGFKLSAKELQLLDEFKHSVAYSTYLKAIKSSPVYVAMMKEHADRIDIENDVVRLKNEGQLPDNISSETLTGLFKQSIARMVINVVADTVILKELEEVSVEDVVNGVKDDANILYLTGLADDKYYKEAQKILEEGKLSRDDVAYRGLMTWMKRKNKIPQVELPITEEIKKPIITQHKSKKELNIDSLNIDVGD